MSILLSYRDGIHNDLSNVRRKITAALATDAVAGSDLKGIFSQELLIPLPLGALKSHPHARCPKY